jgi:GNAT superfamily N-acetyltransferase
MEITYRETTVADIDLLARLRLAFLAEFHATDDRDPNLLAAARDYFAAAVPRGDFIGFFAESDGQVVGVGGMVINRLPPSTTNFPGREAYIVNMYTHPAWRGRGIAARIVALLTERARQEKCRRAILRAVPQARPIYTRAGFDAAGSVMELKLQ